MAATCEEVLDVEAVGIMLEDQQGRMKVLASSNEEMRLLDLMQVQANEGPCWDAAQTGRCVFEPDLANSTRWPRFGPQAIEAGFGAAFALPLRLRHRTIGALNLFKRKPGDLSTQDLQIAEVLASIAAIGLISHQAMRHQEILATQLQNALDSRIVIEQAKGVIAERAGVDIGTAFNVLRKIARSSRRSITDIATEVATGRLNPEGIPRKRHPVDTAGE